MVHKGFQVAWHEIKEQVMDQMATIVGTVQCPPHLLQVYLTGELLNFANYRSGQSDIVFDTVILVSSDRLFKSACEAPMQLEFILIKFC